MLEMDSKDPREFGLSNNNDRKIGGVGNKILTSLELQR